jgi:hypothetical protein
VQAVHRAVFEAQNAVAVPMFRNPDGVTAPLKSTYE